MATSITSLIFKKIVSPSTGAFVDQSIPASGDSGFITRQPAQKSVPAMFSEFHITGSYTTTDADPANPVYIGLSIDGVWLGDGTYRRTSSGSMAFDLQLSRLAATPEGKHTVSIEVRKRNTGAPSDWYGQALSNLLVKRTETYYMDRPPLQPTILSPSSGVSMVVNTADDLILEWSFDEPDKVGAANTPLLEDYGGYEVETRIAPTVTVPNPPWSAPIMYLWSPEVEPDPCAARLPDTGITYQTRRNWTFRLDQLFWERDYGVEQKKIRIVPFPNMNAGLTTMKELRLNPGSWQIRVRGFNRSVADGPRSNPAEVPSTCWSSPYEALVGVPSSTTPRMVSSVSPWSDPVTVYIVGDTLAPVLISPAVDEAVYGDVTFTWQFQTPVAGRTQHDFYIHLREFGTTTWFLIGQNVSSPDQSQTFTFTNGDLGYTMLAGHRYEWTAITRDNAFYVADDAVPQSFWYAAMPDSGPELPLPGATVPDPGLGCGHNRVYVYARGGKERLAEITQITDVTWSRLRDDISSCDVTIIGWDEDCGALLRGLRSWQHELVVFRDNGNGDPKRVWEGPVTRISYEKNRTLIEAKDVMGYVYRRILRQGYNDAYRIRGRTYDADGHIVNPGIILSQPLSVVIRARQIIQNALAYDDPNVLAYLWVLQRADDAKQSRVVPDWSRSAWQEVDDLAAKAGLDYTTVGRRIMLWDTHNAIGTLPEMRDGDFDDPPIVTEYGMQLANVYGVSNNNGVWGSATRQPPSYYGYVEMLVSAWGESDENGQPETLTAEAAAALRDALTGQAERGIGQRWPTPVIARVPDNSQLSPDLSIGINQLIPGVFIPLLSDITLRRVRQMQKLDNIKVIEDSKGEKVQITMSPAPTSSDYDPDGEGSGEDG